jgi:response regulator RpfG family c-di-GMP phosphodiesterase
MATGNKPRVLCVDDEPFILEGLALNLRRYFEVVTAPNGATALQTVKTRGPFAVILSDMRMPGMSGAELLAEVRKIAPNTVRMLLTGHADFESAVTAVNEGQLFRFLTKPCPPELMIEAVRAAAEQNRLIGAEKVLLEQTLAGSIKMLTEVLSLANPVAFGRAGRVKQYVTDLCDLAGLQERWHIETAALLSQIGCITLPPALAEKSYFGQPVTESEQQAIDKVPAVADQLLAHIPRLEPVREILAAQQRRFDGADVPRDVARGGAIPLGARILKLALDLDALETSGVSSAQAVNAMRERTGAYDPHLLEMLNELLGNRNETSELRELPLIALRPGMVFAEDVRSRTGTLLVARGHVVSQGLIERIQNLAGSVKEPIRVLLGKS